MEETTHEDSGDASFPADRASLHAYYSFASQSTESE